MGITKALVPQNFNDAELEINFRKNFIKKLRRKKKQ